MSSRGESSQNQRSNMSSRGESSQNQRSNHKDIPFRVFVHMWSKHEGCSLKLIKPDEDTWNKAMVPYKDYPDVCKKIMSARDQRAFYIMHNLNHNNVLSMRALGRFESQKKGDDISAFVEKYNENLNASAIWRIFAHKNGSIPSPTFQNIIRQIIDGAHYLWRSGSYHGNLSWATTDFAHPYIVKLSGFKEKVLSVEAAQWEDLDAIIAMLMVARAEAIKRNAMQEGPTLVYDELEELINMMTTTPRLNPLEMRELILEEVFFWHMRNRAKFCSITIADWLDNPEFIKEVEESSICPKHWYNKEEKGDLTDFEELVKYCNNYREIRGIPAFPENSRMGFVRFLYAAYTHRSQIQIEAGLHVDNIIQPMFPRVFVQLNGIVKRLVNQA